jgi:hypothetical protein
MIHYKHIPISKLKINDHVSTYTGEYGQVYILNLNKNMWNEEKNRLVECLGEQESETVQEIKEPEPEPEPELFEIIDI